MKKYLGYAVFVVGAMLVFVLYRWIVSSPSVRFGTDRAAVIKQVQTLSRLETASFNIDKVIEASTNYDKLRQFLFGDKILLVASGKVVAGFDLSKMKPEDFRGTGTSVTVNLPAPEIFSSTLDNQQTRVFNRSSGIFTKGELNLEAEARQQAESSIRQAACDGGILDEATKNAKQQIELIFKSSGFTQVSVTSQPAICK